MTDLATYVYAVTRAVDEAVVSGLVGVGGGGVRLLAAGDLQAVVSDVDRAEFEALALEERLEDLTWLAETARAHHRVVDAVGRVHAVAPLALATVYFGEPRVREVLESGGDPFRAVLDRVAGRAEWGVKAYVRERPAAPTETERPRSGAEYLRARRRALREGDRSTQEAQEAAEEVHAAVAALAVASRTHRLQDASLSGTTDPMVLNGAYLVATDAVDELRTLVRSLEGHPRLRIELTGPWVPYSFSAIEPS